MEHPQPEPFEVPDGLPTSEPPRRHPLRRMVLGLLRDILESALLAVLLFLLIQSTVQNTVVEGYSMEPALVNGQRLLVDKVTYRFSSPQRGDIVVFHSPREPGKDLVKRIVGLPGEKVEIRKGQVYINDKLLREDYLRRTGGYSWGPRVVGPGEYFVLGDNRENSSDSHTWGMLPADRIVGKVWFSVWPPERWGPLSTTASVKE